MDTAPLVRMRWRLRGAWLWPSFIALTLIDGAILKALPLVGDSTSLIGGWLLAVVISLIVIVLATAPVGYAVRRLRPDMPKLVARDYAGAALTILVTLAFLGGGLAHRHIVTADRAAFADATQRAESYIGARAPASFQSQARFLDTYVMQAPRLYRICAANAAHTKSYCVVVDRSKQFGRSVRFAGSESNALLFQGTD
jgi:hypothetical protein